MISIPFYVGIIALFFIFWPFTIIGLIVHIVACYAEKDKSKFCEVMMYVLILLLIIFIGVLYAIKN